MEYKTPLTWSLIVAAGLGLFGCGKKPEISTPERPAVVVQESPMELEQIIDQEMVVRLPNHGDLYVINDFHGKFSDYQLFKKQANVFERIKKGEDLYLVINGDTVDYKEGHSEPDGDSKILNDLMKQKAELERAGKGDRVIVLLGNHEQEVLDIYRQMRELMDKKGLSREEITKALYNSKNGDFFRQFNFIERITEEQFDFLNDADLIVQCANGVIITHGSYPRINSENPIRDTLWERSGDGDDFLARIDAELIINGHTSPLIVGRYGGEYDSNKRIGVFDGDRVVIDPSNTATGGGTYLMLDLSKTYETDDDLHLGKELVLLE